MKYWLCSSLLLLALLTGRALRPTGPPPISRVTTANPALPHQPIALRTAAWPRLAPTRVAPPVPADTSARGLAPVWADVRRRSYFLGAEHLASTAPRLATNTAQRLGVRLLPAACTLTAAPAANQPKQGARSAPPLPPPSTTNRPAWQVGFRLRGIGRGGRVAFRPVAAPTLAATTDTSVRYQHGAAFATEFVNTPAGLRQNYYLARRPGGPAGPVRVELALETNLRPVAEGAQAVRLEDAAGQTVLRYADLRAWDATGRALPARLALGKNRIGARSRSLALVVDDTGARYPLTVDPLATTPATTLTDPTNKDGDRFGWSVAGVGDVNGDGFGDVLIGAIGASSFQGVAYLYLGSAAGLRTTPAATLPSPVAGQVSFSFNVAGAGDVNGDGFGDVLTGAYGANSNRGTAYLYLGSASGLSTTPTVSLSDPANTANSFFGLSLGGAGDVNGDGFGDVLVGAYATNGQRGVAYFYLGTATGLSTTPTTTLTSPLNAADARFGLNLGTAGDVNGDGYADVVVSADGTNDDRGAAYVFLGSAAGLSSTPATTLTDPANVPEDNFGWGLAGAGDVNGDGYGDVMVGAQGTTSQGAAYLYLGSAAGLTTTPASTLTDPAATRGDLFGGSVTQAGDTNGDGYADVLIGARGTNGFQGAAYLYLGSATGLGTAVGSSAGTYQVLANPGPTGGQFGYSVAGASDVNGDGFADVLVGAYGINNLRGAAYLYLGSPGTLRVASSTSQRLNSPTTTPSGDFGLSLAGTGDVNGDGFADVLVSAPGAATAYLYLGSATGLPAAPTLSLTSPTGASGDNFGSSVAGAGDVNGDGFGDVLIGADQTSQGRGTVYLYLGSAAGLRTAPAATLPSPDGLLDGRFGGSVAGAGDVNSDGYADIVVGTTFRSTVFFYLGSAAGLPTTPTATLPSPVPGTTFFGISLNGAGDVNGDGFADVLVGAVGANTNQGAAYLFLGSATGLPTTPATTFAHPAPTGSDQFGLSVAGAGDVNGDGFADVLIGANGTDGSRGAAFVYLGSAAGLPTTPAVRLSNPDNGAGGEFGAAVAGLGDVNGDGYADVVVGARRAADVRGAAYFYLGGSGGLATTPSPLFDPAALAASDEFGIRVAGAGDVNGDGYADALVGARGTNNRLGAAYVYRGNQGDARPGGRPRLFETDLTTLLGAANRRAAEFGLGLSTRSAQGRTRARLVWEVAANGTAFSGAPLTNSVQFSGRGPWADLPVGGTELKVLVRKAGPTSRVRARLEFATASPLTAGTTSLPNGTGGVGGTARYGPWHYVTAQQLTTLNALPLPVQLVSFEARRTNAAMVQLNWATASEIDNAGFGVERSADGTRFQRLGFVRGAGTSSIGQRYAFADANGAAAYYRLAQTDADGAITYSAVRFVAGGAGAVAGLVLYPNPATGPVQVLGAASDATLRVYDALGRCVRSSAPAATLDTSGLAPGVYVVRAGQQTTKLVVK